MSRGLFRTLAVVALPFAFAAALTPSLASAQSSGWLEDRQRIQGPGFRVGNLELHPGFWAEGGYDTNVFYQDGNTVGSGILRLSAHLLASTLTQQRRSEGEASGHASDEQRKVLFSGGVFGSFYHYFADGARDNLALDANLDVQINPGGAFGARFFDNFSRSVRPFVDASTVGTLRYARDQNTAGAELVTQSRGGILRGTLGYEFAFDFFEDHAFDYTNSLTHNVFGTLSWRFLPSTALINVTRVQFQNYNNATSAPVSQVADNRRVSSTLGVNGALTNTVSIGATVGYAAGFYDAGDEFQSVNARAELRWRPSQTVRFTLGYARSFNPSFIGNFVKSDKLFAGAQLLAGGSFLLSFDASASFDESGIAFDPSMMLLGNSAIRKDIRTRIALFGEYRFTDWLGLNLTLAYTGDFTDYIFNDPMAGGMSIYPDPAAGFQKFEAWLGVRVFY